MSFRRTNIFSKKNAFSYNHDPRNTSHLAPTTHIRDIARVLVMGSEKPISLYFMSTPAHVTSTNSTRYLSPPTNNNYQVPYNLQFFLQSITHKLKILNPSPIYTTILHLAHIILQSN